jgi:hypothetical protein
MTENLNLYAVWWSQSMEMTSFIFRAADNAALSDDVESVIDGTDIYVTLPPGTDRTDLTPTVTHAGRACYISGPPHPPSPQITQGTKSGQTAIPRIYSWTRRL